MRIGVNLLWIRPGKNGGTESYIRNLLDGFLQTKMDDAIFILFVSQDNSYSFKKYHGNHFKTVICRVDTSSFIRRVVWENVHLQKHGRKECIDVWFMPVYSCPYFMGRTPTVTTIHDLQALHYPEYFTSLRNMYFRIAWKNDCKKSSKIVTISEFCKKDIIKHYKVAPSSVEVIYNPILSNGTCADFQSIAKKYEIEEEKYYYTVSSLAKHKNLITLLKAMNILKKYGSTKKLVITGVKENAEGEIFKYIKENHMENMIVYTGYVTDEIRNSLYDNCLKFLFPSVFEGFGMPPIEAMLRGVPVLTTKEASIFEVTEGLAEYVEDPYNPQEWAKKIPENAQNISCERITYLKKKYDLEKISQRYLSLLQNVVK